MQAYLQFFDHPFTAPAENLACDEALLDSCENFEHGGFVRFWESPSYFVVLGYAKHLKSEVFVENCRTLGIPILRRCSGGGTVLQGPGCLNYTLVLPIAAAPELETITGANQFIMTKNRLALEKILNTPVAIQGHTDLAIGGRKFSGNAQRRKRKALLFHGALLVDFDLPLIGKALRLPVQQPEYRAGRSHLDFLTNLNVDRENIISHLSIAWRADALADATLVGEIAKLSSGLATKYMSEEWNQKW